MVDRLQGLDLRDDAINGFLEKVNEIVDSGGAVVADGVTITGDGTAGNPLVAVQPGGWTVLTQATDQDVTNAQDQDSDTFTFSVTAGVDYAVQAELYFSATNSANDCEFRFTLTAGTMLGRGYVTHLNAADAVVLTALSAVAAASTNQLPVGCWNTVTSPPIPVVVNYSFQPTSNGTFKLQFGNNVTGGGIISRLHAKSLVRYKAL